MSHGIRWPLIILGGAFAVSVFVAVALSQQPSWSGQMVSIRRLLRSTPGLAQILAPPSALAQEPSLPASAHDSMRCNQEVANGYQQCSFTGSDGRTMDLLLHRPASYDPSRKYPLVLVLHGGGERAKTGATRSEACGVLEKAPYVSVWVSDPVKKDVPGVQTRWPSFVVVPLLSGQRRWVDTPPGEGSYHLAESPTPQLRTAKEVVDWLQKEYSGIDPSRLYITGVSLGGYGTWDAIERWPHYFAAAVPVSGGADPSRASELKNLPIWAFHGADDPIVPVSGSRDAVEAIRAAGGHPLYTEYAGAKHDIWSRVYSLQSHLSGESLFEWMFSQHRASGPLKPVSSDSLP